MKPSSVSSAPEVTTPAKDDDLGLDLSLPPKKSFASRRHSGDASFRSSKMLHSPKYDARSPSAAKGSQKRKRESNSLKSVNSPAASVTSPASVGDRLGPFEVGSSPGSPAIVAKNAKLMTSPMSSPAAPPKRDTSSPPPAATSQTKHLQRLNSHDDVTNCSRPPPSSRPRNRSDNSPLSPSNNNHQGSPLAPPSRYQPYFGSASVNSPSVFPERPNDTFPRAPAFPRTSTAQSPAAAGAHSSTPSPMQSGDSRGRSHGGGSNPNSNSSSGGAGDELTIEDVSGANEGDEVAHLLSVSDIKTEPQEEGGSGSRKAPEHVDGRFCQVCGDNAAGFHCGAYVCEACKVRSPLSTSPPTHPPCPTRNPLLSSSIV